MRLRWHRSGTSTLQSRVPYWSSLCSAASVAHSMTTSFALCGVFSGFFNSGGLEPLPVHAISCHIRFRALSRLPRHFNGGFNSNNDTHPPPSDAHSACISSGLVSHALCDVSSSCLSRSGVYYSLIWSIFTPHIGFFLAHLRLSQRFYDSFNGRGVSSPSRAFSCVSHRVACPSASSAAFPSPLYQQRGASSPSCACTLRVTVGFLARLRLSRCFYDCFNGSGVSSPSCALSSCITSVRVPFRALCGASGSCLISSGGIPSPSCAWRSISPRVLHTVAP